MDARYLSVLVGLSLSSLATVNEPCAPGTLPFGDYDRRGDIALGDLQALIDCLDSPNSPPTPSLPTGPAGCLAVYDFNDDGDVDGEDMVEWVIRFTGSCEGLADCPAGSHLLHVSGVSGIPDPDTAEDFGNREDQFECATDQTCISGSCNGHGECRSVGGQAVCACDTGYAGLDCELCATGYEVDAIGACVLGAECAERYCSGQGFCVQQGGDIVCQCDSGISGEYCQFGFTGSPTELRPPTRVAVAGTDISMERGETRVLTATLIGDGFIDSNIVWSLAGPGTLTQLSATDAIYVAPADDGDPLLSAARIIISWPNFPGRSAYRDILITPPGGIKITGQANKALLPFDQMMYTYMLHRCVGGAVVGVSLFGKPIYLRGYGNISGAATNNPAYLAACGDNYDVSLVHNSFGIFMPDPAPVQPNTPFRIGSNSKCVGASVLRRVVERDLLPGPDPTDQEIEDVQLCDLAYNLLPQDIEDVLCDGDPPLLAFPSKNDNLAACPDLSTAPDLRWPNITIGKLMGHRSGLPRGTPGYESDLIPFTFVLRDLQTEADWNDEQNLLFNQTGFPSGTFAAEFPGFAAAVNEIDPGYFFERPTHWDVLRLLLGYCLPYSPGTKPDNYDTYSNIAYELVGSLIEQISGNTFAGWAGRPGFHAGSELELFLAEELGVPIPGQSTAEGIFYSQDLFRLRKPEEPIYREWSASQGHYYPLESDTKRPYCEWTGNFCDVNEFVFDIDRFDWDFGHNLTMTPYKGGQYNSPRVAGALAVEAEVYLRYMAKFWVSGSGSNPDYGKTRCPDGDCIWTAFHSHNGSRDGAYSVARQLGGPIRKDIACSVTAPCGLYKSCKGTAQEHWENSICLGGKCHELNTYFLPEIDPCTGEITNNFSDLECHECRFPVGVDFFVAINQRNDKVCQQAESLGENHPDYYTCDTAYEQLADFMYHALCEVQWPPNPFVLWPANISGETGTKEPFGIGGGGLVGGETDPCCGDGIREPSEACEVGDFGGLSCASYGYEMGSLECDESCNISTALCSGGIGNDPPGDYCGYSAMDCDFSPSDCDADGDCLGGPCARTDSADYQYALDDPFNYLGEFHPDGDYRDPDGNLYYCRDDTGSDEMVCSGVNGWGVCKRCTGNDPLATRVGCSCTENDDCLGVEPNLVCWGEEFGQGTGFCWDASDGPPDWQCEEGMCGMAPWFGDDVMYCEHYSLNGDAECQPWWACNSILAPKCAAQDLICTEDANGCTDAEDCCTAP